MPPSTRRCSEYHPLARLGGAGGLWVDLGELRRAGPDSNTVNIAIGGTATADKNTLTNSDPNNQTDVFLDNNSDSGAATFINLYRNGSTASGSGEALIRQILVDDNTGPLDLTTGFTNPAPAQPFGTPAGLPSQAPLLFAPGGVERASGPQSDETTSVARLAASVFAATEQVVAETTPVPAATTQVAGGATPAAGAADKGFLTQRDLDSLVTAARERWAATGLTGQQITMLRDLKFEVADLPALRLGEAGGSRIRVNKNAGRIMAGSLERMTRSLRQMFRATVATPIRRVNPLAALIC